MIKRFYLSLFFARRFYASFVVVIVLFTLSFGLPFLFLPAQLSAALLLMTAIFVFIVRIVARCAQFRTENPNRISTNRQPGPIGLRGFA